MRASGTARAIAIANMIDNRTAGMRTPCTVDDVDHGRDGYFVKDLICGKDVGKVNEVGEEAARDEVDVAPADTPLVDVDIVAKI